MKCILMNNSLIIWLQDWAMTLTTVKLIIVRWNKQHILNKTEHRSGKDSEQRSRAVEDALKNLTIDPRKSTIIQHNIKEFKPKSDEIENNKSNFSNRHGKTFQMFIETNRNKKIE